jgi:hypothetical protein
MSQSTQTALALPGRKSHSSGDGTQTLRRRSQLQHYTNDVDGFLSAGLRSSSQSPDACTRWRGFERRIRRLRLCGLSNRTSCQGLSKIRPSLTARRLIAPLPNSVQCLRPALTRKSRRPRPRKPRWTHCPIRDRQRSRYRTETRYAFSRRSGSSNRSTSVVW